METATAIKRNFKIGTVDRQGVFIEAKIENGRLSICADIRRGGHCVGGGQSIDTVREVYRTGHLAIPYKVARRLVVVWERWHLNDMRAGCEHQRAAGWDKLPIDPSKPTDTYGIHFDGQRSYSWNMRTWVHKSEHPLGLMAEPCWVCGYKYGTAWLHEELPQEVIDFIESLPEA